MGEARNKLVWQVIALGIAAACGGDSKSGVSTGLPVERKLSTLTDTELQQACRSLDEGAATIIPRASFAAVPCLPAGLQAGLTQSSAGVSVDINKCQQAVDACVMELTKSDGQVEAGPDPDEEGCSAARATDVAGCEATVGEYETCINVVLNALQQKLKELTCQNAETVSSKTYDRDIHADELPECQALMNKCPDAELGIPFETETETAGLQL